MECIQCNGQMKLQKTGKQLNKTKSGLGKFKVRKYECEYCDYTETVYGTNGIDDDRIEKSSSIKEESKERLTNERRNNFL